MLIKFWDLDTRHCFKTLINHRSEVNDFMLSSNGTRLITGCQDNELRIFEIAYKETTKINDNNKIHQGNLLKNNKQLKDSHMEIRSEDFQEFEENSDNENDQFISSKLTSLVECKLIGSIVRESKDALSQLCVDNTACLFGSHSANEKHVEIYKINSEEEIRNKLAKRLKKQKRKFEISGQPNEEHDESNLHFYL